MQMRNVVEAYIDERLRSDTEAMRAVQEFLKNIPGRVQEVEVETDKTNKQGVVDGEKVYKFGIFFEQHTAFIEFYENRSQGEPSMSLYIDKEKALITIKGWRVDKKFYLAYMFHNGKVEKVSKLN